MNHIYRSVWNELTRTFVAAAEVVRGRGKRSRSERSAEDCLVADGVGRDAVAAHAPPSLPHSTRVAFGGIRPMALEPRFMFDGAAVGEVAKAFNAADTDGGVLQFSLGTERTTSALEVAQRQAEMAVTEFLQRPDAVEQMFALFHGGQATPTAEWQSAANALVASAREGNLSVRVELRSSAELHGAKGAFAEAGTTGQATIYLNADWLAGTPALGLAGADRESIHRVLVEELGHYLDARLNTGGDTAGDEGEAFARVLVEGAQPLSVSFLSGQSDHGTLQLDGQSVQVEFAQFKFSNAYEMVYDLDNDNTLDNNERWADKEQNSHYFNTASLGQVTVDDQNYNSRYFSGNDVSAIGINIGGTDYYGWISRPIKSGGVVRGFYFWTDSNFTNLATAQADGNQDGDSNVTDNRGFLLVVDQAWFNAQTASGYTINNTKDGNKGAVSVANVGSSSDRVDSALNALLDSNAAPTAAADTASGTPSNTPSTGQGNAALEQGYNTNTSTVITAAISGSGNVLSNDTDTNSDALSVTKVVSKSTGASTTATAAGTSVVGKYGTLTIKSDGNWTYTPDNSNATVNALLSGNVQEQFTYTASDSKGGASTATLTVQINGSNDAPVAVRDDNTAKEITSSTNTGFNATGNVLTNDTDVDSGDGKTIQGLQISGGATVGDIVVDQGSTSLSFIGDNGFTSVGTNQKLYVSVGGTYRAVYASGGAQVSVSSKLESPSGSNNWVITLSATPATYYDAAGNQTISTARDGLQNLRMQP